MTNTAEPSRQGTADTKAEQRLRGLRMQAYRHLNAAIAESNGELSCAWLALEDPALRSLRERNEIEWRLLVKRHCGKRASDPHKRGSEPHQFPEPPWGSANRRRHAWRAMALLCWAVVAVTALLVAGAATWTIAIGALLIAVALWRSRGAARDTRPN